MKYLNSIEATFIERTNRFIAKCKINEEIVVVHIKNTSRCTELLVEGATVFLEYAPSKTRKTDYSLITVRKGKRLFNLDSQVPNDLAIDGLKNGKIKLPNITNEFTLLKKEVTYQHSRFDIYAETTDEEKCFIEVKGVTLEQDNIVKFPGAPTTRGTKHVIELMRAKEEGFHTFVLFIIQVEGITRLVPYDEMDKKFTNALRKAYDSGVEVLAYDCIVTNDSIEISKAVEVTLRNGE